MTKIDIVIDELKEPKTLSELTNALRKHGHLATRRQTQSIIQNAKKFKNCVINFDGDKYELVETLPKDIRKFGDTYKYRRGKLWSDSFDNLIDCYISQNYK